MSGRLVLVVGPSGVGKDAIIDGARAALRGRADIVFPRRVITRPAGSAGEDHIPATMEEFEAMAARGGFAIEWAAHGRRYGIPAAIADDLAAGRQVVVNVSRAAAEELRRRFPGLLILSITARPETLRQRLIRRGRETLPEIDERVARAAAYEIAGNDVAVISNDGALADAVAKVVALLEAG